MPHAAASCAGVRYLALSSAMKACLAGLLALLDQAARHTGLPLAAGPVASDNRRYAAASLASVGIGAGMAGYHSPADTAARVDPSTMAAICRLVVATGWLAAADGARLSSLIGDKR